MARIAANAMIDPRAELADSVEVGPFCVIGPNVRIGAGTRLLNSVTVMGHVTIGRYNQIYPGAVLGGEPQDLSYRGSDTRVVIGDHNVIREGVTVNRATEKENGITSIGSHVYLMACSHVAHDCQVGDHVVLANGVLLGGHVHVDDYASLSGGVAVHHYTSIGRFAFIGGLSRVLQDVAPFVLSEGSPARPRCINTVALRRRDFHPDVITALTSAYRLLYRARVGFQQASEILRNDEQLYPEVQEMLQFVARQREGRFGRGREHRSAA